MINVSEGRRGAVIDALANAAEPTLLDVHVDPDHNRAVLTLAGAGKDLETAARRLAAEAMTRIDLRDHAGAHPRLGAVDVVPFVPLGDTGMDEALAARGRFATWVGSELGVPVFLYGPERTLPDVRRQAFRALKPDAGPAGPHPTAGAVCAGARPVLVAYNVWLGAGTGVEEAGRVAAAVRGPEVRALGLDVGGRAQVSMNLVEPGRLGPAAAYDAVAALVEVDGAELVGLLPAAVLDAVPAERWEQLDLSAARTIEDRLSAPDR